MLPYFVQSQLLRAVPGVYHAFPGVDPVRGRGFREQLRQAFSVPPSCVGTLRQVHSATVLEMRETDADVPGRRWREGDAIWTITPGTGAGIRTADCVPVLIAHRILPVCAAIHAGWRGMSADVIGEAIRHITSMFGQDALEGLVAAAGPSAKGCCYEVGDDVAASLRACPGGDRRLARGKLPEKWNADLQMLAVDALIDAGISPRNAEAVGPCTICSPRFHSYRREKSLTGRQLSFIYRMDLVESFPSPPGQDIP